MIFSYLILAYASLFVYGMADNIRGPLFPEILSDFSLTNSYGSMMFVMSSLSGPIVGIIVLNLLKRFNRLQILSYAACLMAISLFLISKSLTFGNFLFFSFIIGITSGVIGIIPNMLVTMGTRLERREQYMSGLHSMYGISSLLAPILVTFVARYEHSWRMVFQIVSFFPMVLFLGSFYAEKSMRINKTEGRNTPQIQKVPREKYFKDQMHLAFMLSFAVAAEVMISSRLSQFMRVVHGADLKRSSLYTTYFFIALMLSRVFLAIFKWRAKIKFQLEIFLILSFGFLSWGIFINPFAMALSGFFIAPVFPLSAALIAEKFPDDFDRAMTYVIGLDSLLLALMHLSVGKLTDLFNIQVALVLGLISLVCSFMLLRRIKEPYDTCI